MSPPNQPAPLREEDRRAIDTAKGIVIGLRRCDEQAAALELVGAAKVHGLSSVALAEALVQLATQHQSSDSNVDARSAASKEWGRLLDRAPAVRS